MKQIKRQFTWNRWDFDWDGEAYVIAKDECPKAANVPDFICNVDKVNLRYKQKMIVEDGWCKYQCRTDWDNMEGKPIGSYVVIKSKEIPLCSKGKRKTGWFPVWVVRCGEW